REGKPASRAGSLLVVDPAKKRLLPEVNSRVVQLPARDKQRELRRLACPLVHAVRSTAGRPSRRRMRWMRVEVLYLEGCPNHSEAVEMVRVALRAAGHSEQIRQVEVR